MSTARFDLKGRSLRVVAARGTIINSVFLIALALLGLVRGFVLARYISAEDYGLWGVLIISLGTLLWLKQVGIGDKYIQQADLDQERAFQRAFTLEVLFTGIFAVLILAAIPLVAVVYGTSDVIAPGIALVLVLPALALQAPQWIFYRRLQYAKQRAMQAIDPIVTFIVSVSVAASGGGTWAFVAGVLAGSWASALVAIRWSPYPLRFVYDRGTMRTYVAFSAPLLVASAAGIVIAQGSILATEAKLGLAATGLVTLAVTISQFADRVDQIVTGTLYPAICAVADETEKLYESFVKSNRLALLWAVPFGVGLALFADDLVSYALGEQWREGVVLLQAFGLIAAANQIGFNWSAYFRARADTRPIAVSAVVAVTLFLVITVPLLLTNGLDGFALGMAGQATGIIVVRAHYLRRLFPGFGLARHALRAVSPTVPAAGLILLERLVLGGDRSPGRAAAELAVFLMVTMAVSARVERALLAEAIGYLRGRSAAATTRSASPAV